MRIVHVLHSLAVAGAEVLVHDFIVRQRERATMAVVTLDSLGPLADSLRSHGIEVECVGRKPGFDAGLVQRLARAIARHRPDVVHAHQYTPYFYSALATMGRPGAPEVVFTEHGRHVPDFRRPKRIAFNAVAIHGTARVTAVCAYVKRLLVANEGIAADRIDVVYNGVDAVKYGRAHDGGAVRASLGIAADVPLIACIARFHPVKDHETLLAAFARVHQEIPEARLLLVGDGDRAGVLREQCTASGIGERVIFAGVRNDVPEILAASDLFAMTSKSEGTSVTLLESMLSSVPAVVTAVGGNPEIVADRHTGLLVPPASPVDTAEAIIGLLGDRGRMQAFGRAARTRALGQFTQDRMHAGWLAIYRDALGDVRLAA